MHFYYLQSFDGSNGEVVLAEGYKGILEPVAWTLAEEGQALVILPAVAVDVKGYRLGQGGGYYDRYLQAHPQHPTIALAFEMQVVDHLPVESFDWKVWVIVTEERVIFLK